MFNAYFIVRGDGSGDMRLMFLSLEKKFNWKLMVVSWVGMGNVQLGLYF
jgi:hypothetical protein